MHEERLSPQLGRLIDTAKAAAAQVEPGLPPTEVVALLTAAGATYTAFTDESGADPSKGEGSAAAAAVAAVEAAAEACESAEDREVMAAAIVFANDAADTVSPTPDSYRVLAGIDPELPLVVKQKGRWVMLPLSHFEPTE